MDETDAEAIRTDAYAAVLVIGHDRDDIGFEIPAATVLNEIFKARAAIGSGAGGKYD